MGWRFYRIVALLGFVFLMHGLHALHNAPQTYDDPYFVDKMIVVALAFVAIIMTHQIQEAEDNLKSTQS
jgi:hypothetical protein